MLQLESHSNIVYVIIIIIIVFSLIAVFNQKQSPAQGSKKINNIIIDIENVNIM